MTRWSLITAIALALVVATGALVLAQALARIEGTISAVDVPGNKVTITPEAGPAVTLNVTDKTEIKAPGKDSATLADLKVGQPAEAIYEPVTLNALKIEAKEAKAAKPARVSGQITALDPGTKKVTITPEQGQLVVLTIADATKLEVWGQEPAAFSDLKIGDRVKVTYSPTTMETLEVEVKGKGEPALGARQGLFGTVKAKTDTALTLDTRQGEVVLTLNGDTQYWNPPQRGATLTDVKVGDRVAVLAWKQDSAFVAKRVLIIPPKPVRLQVTGTVSQIEGNTITLIDKDGSTYKAELPQGLTSKIEVGDLFTLTLLKTPGGEKFVAGGVMGGKEMQERHLRFLEKVKAKKAETEAEKAQRAQELEKLGALLQKNMERQQEMMQKGLEKAPPQAKKAIEKAIETSRRGWEQAKEALEKEKKNEPQEKGKRGKT